MVTFHPRDLPEQLMLVAIPPVIGQTPIAGATFEVNWLPSLGPTTFCLVRHLSRLVAADGDLARTYSAKELTSDLGVFANDKAVRAVARGIQFGVLHIKGQVLAVPTTMPAECRIKPSRARRNQEAA